MTTDRDLLTPDDIERLGHSRSCMSCTGSIVADKLIKALRAVVGILAEPDGQLLVSKALLKQAIEKELG